MEINVSQSAISKFNLCCLYKRVYFITDMLDSKHKSLHPRILQPSYQKESLEKFPHIELPQQYWKEWKNIITTIFASIRVSGFHAGVPMRKHHAMWLQHTDRKQIIFKSKDHTYQVYFLTSSVRNKFRNSRRQFHETLFSDLNDFHSVSVNVTENYIETDGFQDKNSTTQSQIISPISFLNKVHTLHKWLQHRLLA